MLAGRALCRQQGPRPTTTITYNAWCTTHALQPTSCRVLHLRGHRKGFRVERWELGTVSGLPCLVSDVWVNQVVPQPQLGPNTPSDQPCKDNNRHKDMIARWLAALLPRPRLHRTVQDDEDRTVARASVLQARMLVHWPDRGGGGGHSGDQARGCCDPCYPCLQLHSLLSTITSSTNGAARGRTLVGALARRRASLRSMYVY